MALVTRPLRPTQSLCGLKTSRLRASYFVPVVVGGVLGGVEGALPPVRRSSRRSIPGVWAFASDTVSTVAGNATLNAAVIPRRENACRRERASSSSVLFVLAGALFDIVNLLRKLPPQELDEKIHITRTIALISVKRGAANEDCISSKSSKATRVSRAGYMSSEITRARIRPTDSSA